MGIFHSQVFWIRGYHSDSIHTCQFNPSNNPSNFLINQAKQPASSGQQQSLKRTPHLSLQTLLHVMKTNNNLSLSTKTNRHSAPCPRRLRPHQPLSNRPHHLL